MDQWFQWFFPRIQWFPQWFPSGSCGKTQGFSGSPTASPLRHPKDSVVPPGLLQWFFQPGSPAPNCFPQWFPQWVSPHGFSGSSLALYSGSRSLDSPGEPLVETHWRPTGGKAVRPPGDPRGNHWIPGKNHWTHWRPTAGSTESLGKTTGPTGEPLAEPLNPWEKPLDPLIL